MKISAFNCVKNVVLSSVIGSTSFASHAAIIDFGSYFSDTDTGLEWLDVTSTVNRSYSDISSQLGIGGEFSGWRYATGLEFRSLLANWTGISGPASGQVFTTGTTPSVDGLVELFGSTLDTYWVDRFGQTWDSHNGYAEGEGIDYTQGILADVFNNSPNQRQVGAIWDNELNGSASDFYNSTHRQVTVTTAQYDIGSYLVRANTDTVSSVNEPNNLILFCAGLLGLAYVRAQKKASCVEV